MAQSIYSAWLSDWATVSFCDICKALGALGLRNAGVTSISISLQCIFASWPAVPMARCHHVEQGVCHSLMSARMTRIDWKAFHQCCRYCQARMFFKCTDQQGIEHELVFVRWYDPVPTCRHPASFTCWREVGGSSVYLRWSAAQPGQRTLKRFPDYGVIELASVIRAVYVQPDFSCTPAEHFFLNRYYRCQP